MTYTYSSKISWLVFLITFVSYSYFFQGGQHNENTRFDLARTLAESGTLEITKYAYNSADIISIDKKIYSGKAPGISFLGAPIWWLSSKIWPLLTDNLILAHNYTCYLITILVVALPSSIMSRYLFLFLIENLSFKAAIGLTLTYALGTIAFPFSTLFFSHQLSAALCFIAFYLCYKNKSPLQIILAGILAGYSVCVEYPLAIACIWLGLYSLKHIGVKKGAIPLIAGGLIGTTPLIIYNLFAFGKILYTPYSVYAEDSKNTFAAHKQGILGITVPDLENVNLILLSLNRGILYLNPITIFFFLAIPSLFTQKKFLYEKCLCLGIILSFFYLNSSFGKGLLYAGGGTSVGPRHLIPFLPFLIFFISDLAKVKFFRFPLLISSIYSIALMLMATATEPRVPYEYDNPPKDLFLKGYLEGHFAFSDNIIFDSEKVINKNISTNVGELLGLSPSIQLLPLIIFWVISYLIIREYLAKQNNKIALSSDTIIMSSFFALIIAPIYFQHINKESTESGFSARYYEGIIWNECEEIVDHSIANVLPPKYSKIDNKLNFNWFHEDFIEVSSYFSADWSAEFEINESKILNANISSDDGSCLYIDNHLLINNWGEHGVQSKNGSLSLGAGKHNIYLRYMNKGSGSILNAEIRVDYKEINFRPKYLASSTSRD